jgi:hypothetical protein
MEMQPHPHGLSLAAAHCFAVFPKVVDTAPASDEDEAFVTLQVRITPA